MKKYNIVNNALGWLCFLIAAVTYLLTIEPTASFWDCPEFISQGAKLEVGHPPGNPIFMLTARFFVTIFGAEITQAAIAVNTMSALLSAATILLLFWTITHLVKKLVVKDDAEHVTLAQMMVIMGSGICGALAYTWSDTFWFSAVEGEVYAFSSFCTALVFWLILKWENRADSIGSDRYLVLIAYVIGVSIAVHLLNLLCIPAIVLVFYYRKSKKVSAKGSLWALALSFVLVGMILYGLVPGFVKVAQGFELFFVNSLGMSYNVGVLIYAVILLGVFGYTIYALYTRKSPLGAKYGVLLTAMLSGLTFITDSVVVWIMLILAVAAYLFIVLKDTPYRIFTVGMLSVFVIFIGYSSYALLLIRASANTPMNQNAPDNVFTLSSYLNREQYGKNPLLYGPVFTEELATQTFTTDDDKQLVYVQLNEEGKFPVRAADVYLHTMSGVPVDNGDYTYSKVAKKSPEEPDKYVKETYTFEYETSPDVNMLFTRMYSYDQDHVQGYKDWSGYRNDLDNLPTQYPQIYNHILDEGVVMMNELSPYLPNQEAISVTQNSSVADKLVWKPSFLDNLRYFFNYQLNHMYWRYFMWNFAGRQNDMQGNGEPHLGNWISGIPAIDNARLGDQSLLPDEFGAGNKGHNVFYMLPLLLGVIGLLWQALMKHPASDERGIEQFWVVFFLFFMTGVAIVLYLNQTPGQPRERDYAFAGSFYAFAIWIGMGVAAVAALIQELFGKMQKKDKGVQYAAASVACLIGLAVPLQMVSQTWDDHDRSGRYTTRDFGENYLNSLDPNAIIFTNGDNDTFPLWYAQEVEGVRTDVRVVNLSYLSTDWYANQLKHPFYDAQAVKFLAQPTDYAYERLMYGYVTGENPQRMNAIDALAQFYAAPASTQYTEQPVKILTTRNLVAPIDTAAVMKAFAINPESTDSITKIPYISDVDLSSSLGSSFTLSKLLSFDIVANAINDNFERPVYFALTVPERYYLNLMPQMGLTGMAYQVIPFSGFSASPVVDKAYENIMSRFRWGGLDKENARDLYLDETVRRMVASTRNSMLYTAQDLMDNGDLPATDFAVEWAKKNGQPVPANRYDMSRNILHLLEEKLPAEAALYDSSTEMTLVTLYLNLFDETGNPDDLARAEKIVDSAIDRYAQYARYALSFAPNSLSNLGYTGYVARSFLPMYIGYKNYIAMDRILKSDPEKYAAEIELLPTALSPSLRYIGYPMLYLKNASSSDLDKMTDVVGNVEAEQALVELHKATGIDQMKVTNDVMSKYGITPAQVLSLNEYAKYLDQVNAN